MVGGSVTEGAPGEFPAFDAASGERDDSFSFNGRVPMLGQPVRVRSAFPGVGGERFFLIRPATSRVVTHKV